MTNEELKKDIHQLVDNIQSNGALVDLHTFVALIVEHQNMPLDDDDLVLREQWKSNGEG